MFMLFLLLNCSNIYNINRIDLNETEIHTSDKATIIFYGFQIHYTQLRLDSIKQIPVDSIVYKDKSKIKQIIDLIISNKNSDGCRCGYDGAIKFTKNGNRVFFDKIEFNIDVKYITLRHNNKFYWKKMNEEGSLFLKELYLKFVPEKYRLTNEDRDM